MYDIKVQASYNNNNQAVIDLPPDSDGILMIKFSGGKVTESSVKLPENEVKTKTEDYPNEPENKSLKPDTKSVVEIMTGSELESSISSLIDELEKESKISKETSILEDLTKIQASLKDETVQDDPFLNSAGCPLFYLHSKKDRHYFTDGRRCFFIDPDKLFKWSKGEKVDWYDKE